MTEHGFPALLARLDYLPAGERALVVRAYQFAAAAHHGVKRKSGEAYITHPVEVASILAELRLDVDAVLAGLLHDTVEDTSITLADIEREFGPTVALLVEGETKVSKLSKMAKEGLEDEQAENLRQLLVAMTRDVRIIIVKLADRLHNMRTLGAMSPVKQQRIARETLEIYAPLAHRLGIGQIKWQLEDLAFKYLEPEAYENLAGQIRLKQNERDAYIARAIGFLRRALAEDHELGRWIDHFEISGRSKHLYSIYRKMQRDARTLEQIFDLMAIRVILTPRPVADDELPADPSGPEQREKLMADAETIREKRVCYHTLGVVHSLWTPIPGRFKDYIAVPKPNGYQSLHSTVISLEGQPIEVQLRTARMHQVAEYGVAAHWLYKDGIEDPLESEQRRSALEALQRGMNWLDDLKAMGKEIKDAGDFVDAVRSDLLGGRVFVFTPKGDTVNMPAQATPVDLAYHIHTDVGHHSVGARINGQIVPLSTHLQNGDRVEIITNRNSAGPSKDWMKFAVTRSARGKIRAFFRAQERAEALANGHDNLAKYLRRHNLPAKQFMRTRLLEDVTEKLLGSRNPDDLYLALHANRVTNQQVARVLAPESAPSLPLVAAPTRAKPRDDLGLIVEGGLNAPVKLAQCCRPIRGDEVMGFVTRGRGVTIHRKDCPNAIRLAADDPARCLSAHWASTAAAPQTVDLELVGQDRPALLKDVLDVLASLKKSALKVEASVHGAGEAHIYIRLDVRHNEEFTWIRDALLRLPGLQEVTRRGVRPPRA
ncbi:MAG TPA: bifunctional (p)ppGpp synthetase/guanosine-3',5'-bis(diphosphate) 3'-pyrophosphohydrolase [Deinococcales bacterium]|nr:bifunctional (p)ppGpp synthetase/guanosine-3',5'-bis(diphosphate) 3'-pyrophosphohydrolase [Deinococcales bacterium]